MDTVRSENDHVIVLSGGANVSSKNDPEWQRQSYFLLDILADIGMDAMAVLPQDLHIGLERMKEYEEKGLPYLCANFVDEEGRPVFPGWKMISAGGEKVGIFAVSEGPNNISVKIPKGYSFADEKAAAEKALDELKAAGCTQIVMLYGGRRNEAVMIGDELADVDLIFYGESNSSLRSPVKVGVNGRVASAASRGKDLGEIELSRAADGSIEFSEFTIHELDKAYSEDPAIHDRVEAFKAESAERKKRTKLIKELAAKNNENESSETFTGTETCKRCHIREYEIWSENPHANALASLEIEFEESNPDCIGCHVTGWEMAGGYGLDKRNNDMLRDVQCEACHGYGTTHDRSGGIMAAARNSCTSCHDAEMSPDFDFDKYWTRIEH